MSGDKDEAATDLTRKVVEEPSPPTTDRRMPFVVMGRGDGWQQLGVGVDRAGRRGVWYRERKNASDATDIEVEICAGREGGDAYVTLGVGEVLTPPKMRALLDVLEYANSALEYQHTTDCIYFFDGTDEADESGQACNCGSFEAIFKAEGK